MRRDRQRYARHDGRCDAPFFRQLQIVSRPFDAGGFQRESIAIEVPTTVTQHSRDTPQFYLTAPSPCPYLAGKEERKVFTHLVGERAPGLNDLLTHGGFPPSQSNAYPPALAAPP